MNSYNPDTPIENPDAMPAVMLVPFREELWQEGDPMFFDDPAPGRHSIACQNGKNPDVQGRSCPPTQPVQ